LIGHLPSLRRYAVALTGRASEADDLVQDCIERALIGRASLREPDRMGAWLRSILHNLARDGQRRGSRFGTVGIDEMQDDLALSVAPQDELGMRDLNRAIQSLSFEHRQILLMVGVEGLSYREVAAELGIPIGTVMSRLARARDRFRAALESPPPVATVVQLPDRSRGCGA
jgi:RNA polymerase sigma-70 factor (ECF subfamily)